MYITFIRSEYTELLLIKQISQAKDFLMN